MSVKKTKQKKTMHDVLCYHTCEQPSCPVHTVVRFGHGVVASSSVALPSEQLAFPVVGTEVVYEGNFPRTHTPSPDSGLLQGGPVLLSDVFNAHIHRTGHDDTQDLQLVLWNYKKKNISFWCCRAYNCHRLFSRLQSHNFLPHCSNVTIKEVGGATRPHGSEATFKDGGHVWCIFFLKDKEYTSVFFLKS